MFEGAKVLVTGGAGFIGVNLLARLRALGCQLRATLHERPAIITDDTTEYVQADLTTMHDCERAVAGMDYVFLCAASTSGAAMINQNPLIHVTPNVVMNAQILEAAYRAGVKKVLFIGSCAAYPSTGNRPVREDEMFNGDPPDVYYTSGWMKRYAEILCQTYAIKIKNPMPTVVVRPSNIYGPYDKFDFRTSHVTAALIRRVVERHNPIEVWGTGEDVRDLIYIDDFIEGLLLAFEKAEDYLAVNLASGQGFTVKQILQTIIDVDGYTEAPVTFDPTKPRTIPARLVDTTLASERLGFRPRTNLADGLKRTAAWYREHASIWTK